MKNIIALSILLVIIFSALMVNTAGAVCPQKNPNCSSNPDGSLLPEVKIIVPPDLSQYGADGDFGEDDDVYEFGYEGEDGAFGSEDDVYVD